MGTAKDACLTKIEGQRLYNAIVEDASPMDQNKQEFGKAHDSLESEDLGRA